MNLRGNQWKSEIPRMDVSENITKKNLQQESTVLSNGQIIFLNFKWENGKI